MATQPGPALQCDVAVVGAGPTGLMMANLLGLHGLRVCVFEAGPALIDYPRGVGMDDETLRAFQAAGLVDAVLPHTVPHQLLVFTDARQRVLARLAPPAADFGWPRRNGFVQPLADRVLLDGLERFPAVDVHWSSRVTAFRADAGGVDLTIAAQGGPRPARARFVVGADGGRSDTRKALGLAFPGSTAAADWLVIDLRNDPLGRPGAYVCADPRRPHVSIGLPHGIRRFEFMLKAGETEAAATSDEFVAGLLAPLVPPAARVEIIRRRVYTHQSRMAERFRSGRVFLIGDAAHVMPVWQGQGYNSGIRDAVNLSWKLAMVIRGRAGDALLDTYEAERRDHVRAMIQLSTWVGRVVSITGRARAAARNAFFRGISAVPRAKSYIVQMRFKPMPALAAGALTRVGALSDPSPVGRLFIQPTVSTREAPSVRLDDVLGPWFALLAWSNDPRAILDADARQRLARAGVRLVSARPAVQLSWDERGPDASEGEPGPDARAVVVGDLDGTLKRWFDERPESVVLVRPDRIVGGASPAYAASDMVRAFDAAIGAPDPAAGPAPEPAGGAAPAADLTTATSGT